MSRFKLKKLVFIFKIIVNFVLYRSFGRIINDYAQKYKEQFSISDFRKLEKLHIKQERLRLDVNFLINCRNFNVYPKFTTFRIPNSSEVDTKFIKKRLLKSAIKKRTDEKRRTDNQVKKLVQDFRKQLSGIDWFVIMKAIRKNVTKARNQIIKTHQ